jgi:hypothetical protein
MVKSPKIAISRPGHADCRAVQFGPATTSTFFSGKEGTKDY